MKNLDQMSRIKLPDADLYSLDLQERREVPLRFNSSTVILSMNATGPVGYPFEENKL